MLSPRLEMSMTPSSEPAPGHGLQVAVIGGVLVTRDEIVKALAVLKGRPDTDTWILPRLIDIEPAGTDGLSKPCRPISR